MKPFQLPIEKENLQSISFANGENCKKNKFYLPEYDGSTSIVGRGRLNIWLGQKAKSKIQIIDFTSALLTGYTPFSFDLISFVHKFAFK